MENSFFFWPARPSETDVCGLKSRIKIPKIGKMFCQAEEIGLKVPFAPIKNGADE
ncbi:hypothetical protein [Ligilactobacillus ruminis]|uniref:hypothetical protein n=1 Tax=Ligilactobacillus ruminis TaxID=1623 RepID=UPI001F31B407|nr:hypothetical protein [Ligilactobacillus ruminis]